MSPRPKLYHPPQTYRPSNERLCAIFPIVCFLLGQDLLAWEEMLDLPARKSTLPDHHFSNSALAGLGVYL